jgi:NADP-dependent 3-hydroxy acid dehydrogenase YdfG
LVNNAGGAFGLGPIEDADLAEWQAMYDTNVLGILRMTRALLPKLIDSGDGHVIVIGSIAAHEPYPGGAGYNAAKFAARAVTAVLRQELLGRPVRVTEVDPGMVETEFSLVRFAGDADRAAMVYEGVTPLSPDDIAECITFAATRPSHVNIDSMIVLARDQAGARNVHRRQP